MYVYIYTSRCVSLILIFSTQDAYGDLPMYLRQLAYVSSQLTYVSIRDTQMATYPYMIGTLDLYVDIYVYLCIYI